MTRQRITLILCLALVAALLAGCGGAPGSADLTPVELSLVYIPDVQFAPIYTGIEKGIFAEHGIDLSIEHRQETDNAKLVATGELKFAILSGEQVLLAREEELPLVYVFEWYQRYPVAIAARPDVGLTEPADLAGLTVGTPVQEGASYIGLEALLGAAGLTDADIDLQTIGYSQVEMLATDRVDAAVIYATNEPVQLDQQGIDVDMLYVSDYADLVSNGMVTSEQVIAEEPELVRSMVAALAESVQYAIDHPDEAFESSAKYVEGLDDPEISATGRAVLDRSIDLWKAGTLGVSDRDSWVAMQGLLLNIGLLDAEQDVDAAFSNDFLP